MYKMFRGATNFNQPLSNWDVKNVTVMRDMFRDATSFNQDLSSWDVSSVTNHTNFDTNWGSGSTPPNFP